MHVMQVKAALCVPTVYLKILLDIKKGSQLLENPLRISGGS